MVGGFEQIRKEEEEEVVVVVVVKVTERETHALGEEDRREVRIGTR